MLSAAKTLGKGSFPEYVTDSFIKILQDSRFLEKQLDEWLALSRETIEMLEMMSRSVKITEESFLLSTWSFLLIIGISQFTTGKGS
jgi:hypothetical protein